MFGAFGLAFRKFELPSAPFIPGFIPGPLAEVNYRRGMINNRGNFLPFLTNPISAVFLAIAVIVIVMNVLKPLLSKKKAGKKA